MIKPIQSDRWQTSLMNAVTDPKLLLDLLELDPALLPTAEAAARLFPLKVPHSFLARIKKGDPTDPLLLQALPLGAELEQNSHYSKDPLQEAKTNPIPGLLHKYNGRVLLTFTGTCGINCRYCFRRAFPYTENNPGSLGWERVLDYILQDSSISEVILSGGDPLIASDYLLKNFIEKVALIPHVKRLRIHSRMPIVLPERITNEFIDSITCTRLKPIMIVHCNHPQEINQEVIAVMQQMSRAGIVLLNQSVLLKNINDQAEILIELSEALFAAGIQPYYLHLLDKVEGSAHFDSNLHHARQIHWEMAQKLSGYLVPQLVCEQPGAPAKLSLGSWDLYTG